MAGNLMDCLPFHIPRTKYWPFISEVSRRDLACFWRLKNAELLCGFPDFLQHSAGQAVVAGNRSSLDVIAGDF